MALMKDETRNANDSDFEIGIEEAWKAEVRRRVAEMDRGEERSIPWKEACSILEEASRRGLHND